VGFLKCQVSVEYLLIIGFVAVMTLPLILLYYTYTLNSSDEIIVSQTIQLAKRIVDAAESVYSLGEPSQTVIKVYVPNNIAGVSLDNKELQFNVSTQSGIAQIVDVSSVNLTGKLPIKQGTYSITLNATNTGVKIGYK
jgi:hypothetical protein